MARTLQSSGIATSLDFLLCVDDDNATIKVFKSLNTSSSDNTSSVQTDMTIGGGVSVSTMSWNGHTVPYMVNNPVVSYAAITFGTNKPYLKSSTGGVGTYFMIGRTPSVQAGDLGVFGGTTSSAAHIGLKLSTQYYAVLYQTANNWAVYSAAGYPTTSADNTWAFVHNSTSAATCRMYAGTAGGALAQNNTNSSDPWNIDGELTFVLGADSVYHWSDGRIIMVGKFSGEINSTDLGSLHSDPFGTLFVTAAATRQPTLLTLGAG